MDVFTKHACIKPFLKKKKKDKTVLNAFIEIVNESNRKPNKLWVDQGREFYSKLTHEWLDNNDILMYSIHSEGKSVMAERFIKTLKVKIFKKITADNSKFHLSYLNKLVYQYSNTYHHSNNKKPINAHYSALNEKIKMNPKAPKFKINDRVRITKYRNVFSKGYTENCSREILGQIKLKCERRKKDVFMKKNYC